MSGTYDGAAIRALVDKLPPQAFDALCDECGYLLDGIAEWQTDYITFEPLSERYTLDDLAQDRGFDDYAAWEEEGCYLIYCDGGVVIIE